MPEAVSPVCGVLKGLFNAAVPLDKISEEVKIVTPPLLRPPELLLGHPWSTPIDVWAVGCMVTTSISAAAGHAYLTRRCRSSSASRVHLCSKSSALPSSTRLPSTWAAWSSTSALSQRRSSTNAANAQTTLTRQARFCLPFDHSMPVKVTT